MSGNQQASLYRVRNPAAPVTKLCILTYNTAAAMRYTGHLPMAHPDMPSGGNSRSDLWLIALAYLSFAAWLVNSTAVSAWITTIRRLAGKFL